MDIAAHRKRARAMLTLLEVSAGRKPFSEWVSQSEATVVKKNERLEDYLETLLTLLQDMLHLRADGPLLRHPEYREPLAALAAKMDLTWVRKASHKTDEMYRFLRRNAQKTAALDDFAVELLQSTLARR